MNLTPSMVSVSDNLKVIRSCGFNKDNRYGQFLKILRVIMVKDKRKTSFMDSVSFKTSNPLSGNTIDPLSARNGRPGFPHQHVVMMF